MRSKIAEVPGVGLVDARPAATCRPIRVEADPQKLAAYGLNIDDLRTLLGNITVSQPERQLRRRPSSTTRSTTTIRSPIRRTTSMLGHFYQNGSPVRLRDVAHGQPGRRRISSSGAWYDGTAAIVLNVQRQPGANVIKTVNQIKQQLPQLAGKPAAVDGMSRSWRTAPG